VGAPPPALSALSIFHVTLAVIVVALTGWLWRRVRRGGLVRALTWDCAYALPTGRMQYTAGSFAGIINEWFAWILRPERHQLLPENLFPAVARYAEHTPETVLEKIVQPAALLVMRVSTAARSLQHGRVQAYLLYLLIGVGALSLLVLLGGAQ
jgi:hydrogenase-4 component B